jgi:pyridoxal phosphate enzyme (YggS family)
MTDKSFALQTIRERFENVRSAIDAAARRMRRAPEDVTLIAIGKTHPPEILRTAIAAGVTNLGENRVQEAEAKIPQVGRDAVRWHLVGHLQANKARRAVALFDVIHSLDSVSLAHRLDRLCTEQNRNALPVLIQVDLAGEQTKTGVEEQQLPQLLEAIRDCARLQLLGLMTLPPYFEDPECTRPFFKALRELRDQLSAAGHFGSGKGELSMGMSHNYEVAIEEGATMVRVGTAIFGERG